MDPSQYCCFRLTSYRQTLPYRQALSYSIKTHYGIKSKSVESYVSLQVTKCLVDLEGKQKKKYCENYLSAAFCEVLKGLKMAKARC